MDTEISSRSVCPRIRCDAAVNIALVALNISLSAVGARGETPPASAAATVKRPVQAIEVQSNSTDGETTWIIKEDVLRIPKVAGLDRQLPPHVERRLSYAFDLAQRGAIYTADAEFRAVLGLCALELDSREGGTRHREALRQGWIAIHEADQFGGDQVDWRESADVRHLALGHTTPVLRNASTPVDSIQAVQAYYAFAEERLAFSCHKIPGSSLAFYGLARTLQVPGMSVSHAAGKAALLHRVALDVAPQNVLAANELGVLLANHGQLAEAQSLFQQCVAIDATPEIWRNLAAVYARQGNETARRSALAASESLAEKERQLAAASTDSGQQERDDSPGADKKVGIAAKLNFIPKLSNPFRR